MSTAAQGSAARNGGTHPPNLVVVGAAGGMARLISELVLSKVDWEEVFLLDTRSDVFALQFGNDATKTHRIRVVEQSPDQLRFEHEDGSAARLDGVNAAVMLAVPQGKIPSVARAVLSQVGSDSVAFDIGSEKTSAMDAMSDVRPELAVFGTHPLFGFAIGTVVGQTVVICPSETMPGADEWLTVAIEDAGGTVKTTSAEDHDSAMAYVQTAAHQALIIFADVVSSSGLDLEGDLWASRTPQFETLLAMASRVLVTEQVETIASIQLSTSGARIAEEMSKALERLRGSVQSGASLGSSHEVEAHLKKIGERFPGALFQYMQQASGRATSAVQAPRSLLARLRLNGELVGVSTKTNPELLRVGYVKDLTSTSVEIENLLVGSLGKARLIGHNDRFAGKLGIGGKKTSVQFSIGNIDLAFGEELETLLDEWLASTSTDVMLRGPESVSAHALSSAASGHPIVRGVEIVDEEVRNGERHCLIRCFVRADRDPSPLALELQERCDEMFAS